MHLILDLDGTLIYCDKDNNIIKRPYLDEFLTFVFEFCDSVSIWTAADKDYAYFVIRNICPSDKNFLFIKTRQNTHIRYFQYMGFDQVIKVEKRLSNIWKNKTFRTLGLNRHNTLIIEDTPSTCVKNYGNAIYVDSFKGDPNDTYLRDLMTYLKTLKNTNVRRIEKRYWEVYIS